MVNLRALRISRKLTQQELAEHIGVERTSIGKYEKHNVLPNKELLFKIADFFNVSIDFLLGRKPNSHSFSHALSDEILHLASLYERSDDRCKSIIINILEYAYDINFKNWLAEDPPKEEYDKPIVSVPVVGKAAAGLPIEMIEDRDGELCIEDSRIKYGDFAVVADGDSMIDAGIHDGDRVIIRPQPTVDNGELALIAVDGGSTIKRFYRQADGYRLEPANPEFKAQFYKKDADVKVLGKVIKVMER